MGLPEVSLEVRWVFRKAGLEGAKSLDGRGNGGDALGGLGNAQVNLGGLGGTLGVKRILENAQIGLGEKCLERGSSHPTNNTQHPTLTEHKLNNMCLCSVCLCCVLCACLCCTCVLGLIGACAGGLAEGE